MRASGMIRCLLVLFLIVLAVESAYAQDDPNFEIGLKPFGTYNMGNIDNVNLGNGSLGVNIPLISYPQRGSQLKLDFSLHYFNGSGSEQQVCENLPIIGEYCYYQVNGAQPGLAVIDQQALTYATPFGSGGGNYCSNSTIQYCNFYVLSTDGSMHPYYPSNATSTTFRTADATGILGTTTGSPELGATTFIDAQGITHTNLQPHGVSDTRTDTNGNTITYSSTSGWIDSMGRVIPSMTKSTNSSDFTGCTGAQPIAYVYLWNPPGPNGGSYPLKFCYSTVTFYDPYAAQNETLAELTSVLLPNNTSWTFAWTPSDYSYFGTPDLSEITFPTGGTLSYTWGASDSTDTPYDINHAVLTRTLDPNDGASPSQWSYGWNSGGGITETDPAGNTSVHWFGLGSPGTWEPQTGLYENEVKYYQGSNTSGSPIETVQTTYSYNNYFFSSGGQNVVPIQVVTIWRSGQQSKITYSYDSGFTIYDPQYYASAFYPQAGTSTAIYGDEITKQEYDYDDSLLRTTSTNYKALSDSAYLNANLLRLPSSVQVTGVGPGSQTEYSYDENNGSPQGALGNLTSVHRWLNTTQTYLPTTDVYNANGLITSSTDPNGNTTTYGYSNNYPPQFSCASGYTGSGPTSVTNALGQTTYYCYDTNTGLRTATFDPNGITTSYAYDQMLRPLHINVDNGDGSQTYFCYTDTGTEANGGNCSQSAPPYEAVISEKITSSLSRNSYLMVDGVGREIRQAVTNGESKPYDEIDTCYDGNGRVSFKSYPFQDSGPFATARSCALPELGDTFAYDALGRTTTVTHTDGSFISTDYSNFPCVTVTDEAGKSRQSCTDGLSRLTKVTEDPGGLNYVTNYSYDALDNLTSVVQSGERNRTFVYDSLSRLVSSTNPESNWSGGDQVYVPTTYSYDADGNLVNKTEPAQNQQGTSTVTLTYCYDALNRITAKGYTLQTCSNGRLPSPVATYVYDGDQPPTGCGVGSFNYGLAIGKRTAMCDQAGTEAWGYNITAGVGWKTTDQRTTNNVTKTSVYQDDLLGAPLSIQYPSGRTVDYTPNAGDRPVSAVDASTSVSYANPVHYWANGSPCWEDYGSAITGAETFNSRQQPLDIQASAGVVTYQSGCPGLGQAGNLLDLSYCFYPNSGTCPTSGTGNNGNVMAVTNNVPGDSGRSQSFAYDALNRIMSAQTTATYSTSHTYCWGETYQYDDYTNGGGPWGNLSAITPMTGNYTGCSQESGFSYVITAQNQISASDGYAYDAAGNLTNNTGTGATYSYNAENQLTSTAGVNYTYDGDGNRVEKSNGTLYWYGIDGNVLDETDLSGNVTNEYVYLGSRRIARVDPSGNAFYYLSDSLGTSRVTAEVPSGSTTATMCYDADFYPFGGERPYVDTCDSHYKFTGKERDSESGNDYFGARYYGSSAGRLLTPDPLGGKLVDPQTLNKYVYVADNPLSYTDPTGLYLCADSKNCSSKQDKALANAIASDLRSKNKDVVRAARAYGKKGEDNGVTVKFGDPGKGRAGITSHGLRQDPNNPNKIQANETVTLRTGLRGSQLDATVGHEGSHVADAQAFAATINANGSFNPALNLTIYQTEMRAYMVTQSVLSSENVSRGFGTCGAGPCILGAGVFPAQARRTIQQLLANPANGYGVTPTNQGPNLYPDLTTPH